MYIRCTTTRTKVTGETYKTFRLVESERIDGKGKVKQHTLLNLGRYFDVPKPQWKLLSSRINQLLSAQTDWLTIDLEASLETLAQCYTAQIIASRSTDIDDDVQFETVDVSNIELVRPRRVGVEQIALHAVKQLALDDKLKSLGFNKHQLAASLGTIIGRMALPASELATHGWLSTMTLKAWGWIACIRYLIYYGNTGKPLKPIYTSKNAICSASVKPLRFMT
jgi:hypothetical protein